MVTFNLTTTWVSPAVNPLLGVSFYTSLMHVGGGHWLALMLPALSLEWVGSNVSGFGTSAKSPAVSRCTGFTVSGEKDLFLERGLWSSPGACCCLHGPSSSTGDTVSPWRAVRGQRRGPRGCRPCPAPLCAYDLWLLKGPGDCVQVRIKRANALMHQNTQDPMRQVIRVLRGRPIVVSRSLIRVTDESGQEGSLGTGGFGFRKRDFCRDAWRFSL